MKKKIIVIVIIALVLVMLAITGMFSRGGYFYVEYSVSNESYFGNEYKEVLHTMSPLDKSRALTIMQTINEAFSFIGTKDVADSKFGALSRYCLTDEGVVKGKHKLKLITADFDDNKGCLWFVYSQEGFDNGNKTIRGSKDILVRAKLEKRNNEWIIVSTNEHP